MGCSYPGHSSQHPQTHSEDTFNSLVKCPTCKLQQWRGCPECTLQFSISSLSDTLEFGRLS